MKIFVVLLVYCSLMSVSKALVDYTGKNSELEKNQIKPPSSKATIIRQEYKRFNDGGYRFYYETSDFQSREEIGYWREDPKLGKIFNVHGSYGYIGPTNKKVFVKYVSDERGFRYENSPFPPVGLPSNIINQQLGLFNFK